MNIENRIEHQPKTAQPKARTDLLNAGLSGLSGFVARAQELDGAIAGISDFGDRGATKGARKLQMMLRRLEPSVTMIGQVKAGKTTLVNSMVGWPDLLPADVNPWTSVVTSLHISPRRPQGTHQARFRFFEEQEWTRLLDRGGRIGELAGRAGADDELQKVRRQLEEMREKSRKRLGDKFELLLGQEHNYGYFDADLIERYVCLGDNFEDDTETSTEQGRFADVTKSADLYLERGEFPINLCIRDTPGVNDTFMMREQITIRAIRESRLCVVVLSAHQALSTVDMALIRLISNIPSREVFIFVNRIDELSDPARQVPEIRESIQKTLAEHQGPKDASIIFGSAHWATAALSDNPDQLDDASSTALANWAGAELTPDTAKLDPVERLWELSGVPELYRVLADRIENGVGAEVIDKVARGAVNLVGSVKASRHVVGKRDRDSRIVPLDPADIPAEVARIEALCLERMRTEFDYIQREFNTRLDRSHRGFLERATGSLIHHLEEFGEQAVWHYDPTGLRVLLRSAYQVFARKAQGAAQKVLSGATQEVREVYLRAFGVPDETFRLEAPPAPPIPSPVLLGQTIALDLKGSWWSRWWHRRRGYRAFAMDFAEIIKAETDPIFEGLQQDHAKAVADSAVAALSDFMASQQTTLTELARKDADAAQEIAGLNGAPLGNDNRAQAIEETEKVLSKFVAGESS